MAFTPEKILTFRAKWIAALRSGKYKQAAGCLAIGIGSEKSYCCLGVAQQVLYKDLGIKKPLKCEYYLPNVVVSALGLLTQTGCSAQGHDSLTDLNDIEGLSFEQIADLLDAQDSPYFRKVTP
jgi:hypothetical protein